LFDVIPKQLLIAVAAEGVSQGTVLCTEGREGRDDVGEMKRIESEHPFVSGGMVKQNESAVIAPHGYTITKGNVHMERSRYRYLVLLMESLSLAFGIVV